MHYDLNILWHNCDEESKMNHSDNCPFWYTDRPYTDLLYIVLRIHTCSSMIVYFSIFMTKIIYSKLSILVHRPYKTVMNSQKKSILAFRFASDDSYCQSQNVWIKIYIVCGFLNDHILNAINEPNYIFTIVHFGIPIAQTAMNSQKWSILAFRFDFDDS